MLQPDMDIGVVFLNRTACDKGILNIINDTSLLKHDPTPMGISNSLYLICLNLLLIEYMAYLNFYLGKTL